MAEGVVLCVCGLAAEARIARAAGFAAVVGAGDPALTAAVVAAALPQARCLVSFGIAGGLAPQLRPGDVVVSAEVTDGEQRWRSARDLPADIAALGARRRAAIGPVYGARSIFATAADKSRTWRATGALAVDLESAIVAASAAASGLPFLVLRAIADPATRNLPPAALLPLAAAGKPALWPILAEVLCRPRQIAALSGLALDTRQALRGLAGAAQGLHRMLAAT